MGSTPTPRFHDGAHNCNACWTSPGCPCPARCTASPTQTATAHSRRLWNPIAAMDQCRAGTAHPEKALNQPHAREPDTCSVSNPTRPSRSEWRVVTPGHGLTAKRVAEAPPPSFHAHGRERPRAVLGRKIKAPVGLEAPQPVPSSMSGKTEGRPLFGALAGVNVTPPFALRPGSTDHLVPASDGFPKYLAEYTLNSQASRPRKAERGISGDAMTSHV